MKKNSICIGSAGRDLFFPLEGIKVLNTPEDLTSQKNIVLELGAKYRTESRYEALGGCAANVALALSRLGERVSIQTVVGNDGYGKEIIEELSREGVNTDRVLRDASSKTDVSCILVETKSADRVIVYNRDANEHLLVSKEDVPEGSVVFLGGMYGAWKKNLSTMEKLVQDRSVRLFYNPGQKNIKENVQRVMKTISVSEIVFLNKDEAIEIILRGFQETEKHRVSREKYIVKKMYELGAKCVVVTDGNRGAWAYNGEECYHGKSLHVEHVVESTGAGDACTGAFLAAYLRKKRISECLRWGVANGASAVQHYGAKEGLLTLSEMEARMQRVEILVVQ